MTTDEIIIIGVSSLLFVAFDLKVLAFLLTGSFKAMAGAMMITVGIGMFAAATIRFYNHATLPCGMFAVTFALVLLGHNCGSNQAARIFKLRRLERIGRKRRLDERIIERAKRIALADMGGLDRQIDYYQEND